jgi:hypothetical protein
MTTLPDRSSTEALEMPSYGQVFLWINAVVAWCGVLLQFTLSVSGHYVDAADPAKLTILGNVPEGIDTPLERFLDTTTYFTILSNVVVAVVMTALLARPSLFGRPDVVGTTWRTLRLDSVLMIVITGVVYNVLLVEGGKVGWDALSNTLIHVVTPLLTVIVWIIAGPRGLITPRIIGLSLVLPLLWAAYALVRGLAVGAYPYPFLDLSTHSAVSVIAFLLAIVVVAVILALLMLAVDAGLRWTSRPAMPGTASDDGRLTP